MSGAEISDDGIHSHFTFGERMTFELVRIDETRGEILAVIKRVHIDVEDVSYHILVTATQAIDAVIAEGKVPAQERGRLIEEARSGIVRLSVI